jgi:hypothetical protein
MRKDAFYTARIRKSIESSLNEKRVKEGRLTSLNTYIEELLNDFVEGRLVYAKEKEWLSAYEEGKIYNRPNTPPSWPGVIRGDKDMKPRMKTEEGYANSEV